MGLFHHAFSTSFTEFVYFGCWHFDNGATSNFADVLLEHGGLPHVLPLAVYLNVLGWTSRGDHSKMFLLFEFVCGTPPCLKVRGGCGWVGGWVGGLQHFSVSPSPLWF